MPQIILASASPRRRELLEQAGIPFHPYPVQVSEYLEKNLTLDQQILSIARKKLTASWQSYKPLKSDAYLFLSADTLVIYEDQVLGKPEDSTAAKHTLRLLSGKKHLVKTAVCLACLEMTSQNETVIRAEREDIVTTEIEFRDLSDAEIQSYVESGDPFDKAGGYGIQGEASKFVRSRKGSYENVVGLPIENVKKLIQEIEQQTKLKFI